MMRRILSVWLPRWPITRLNRNVGDSSDRPLVVVETVHGIRRLTTVGAHGETQGLRAGQTLGEARAMCPALLPVEADPAADAASLLRIAAWCERYTPMVATDPPDGLWLDITGCAGISPVELLQDLADRLHRHGIPCRLAVAGTTGAAWALAHTGAEKNRNVLPPGQEIAALADLPLTSLRIDADTVAGLHRLGLRTVRELRRIPRADITARFGASPVLRLDQALGLAEEAMDWLRPPIAWFERLAFVEPVFTPEVLADALSRLARRLCERLAEQEKGGRRFTARFFRVDNTVSQVSVATALPVRDAAYLGKLLREKLEIVDPGYGVEVAVLEVEAVAPLQRSQARLVDPAAPDAAGGLPTIVDTLTNRLGPERIWRFAPCASHVPERAVRRVPPISSDRPSWVADPAAPRPIRLLRRPELIEVTAPVPDDPPMQFRWRGALHRVRAAVGPERIAAEWWRGSHPADGHPQTYRLRDYYRVEDVEGVRFWIFHADPHTDERCRNWYLHGFFA